MKAHTDSFKSSRPLPVITTSDFTVNSMGSLKPYNLPQIYKQISDFDKGALRMSKDPLYGDINRPSMKHDDDVGSEFMQLLQQIKELQNNHSKQSYRRYEAEAFILRKKRTNQYRVGQRTFPISSLEFKDQTGAHINTQIQQKKPGNKNAVKLHKLLKKFFELNMEDDSGNRFLSFIAQKHKFPLPENLTAQFNWNYYNENEIRKIKKYQKNNMIYPPLGIEFDYENKINQDEEPEKIVQYTDDLYEEGVNCFDERPEITLEQGTKQYSQNLFKNFLDKNKKQLFKGAKVFNRVRMQKQMVLKKLAYLCVREVDRRYKKCLKNQSDFISRAKKIHRQGLLYWKKRDKQLIQLKKKKEKIEADIKRRNEEKQEEETQKKKLDYIMKQSVLYSHFMAKKLGMEPENKELMEEDDQKEAEIDIEAAQLNVNQMITKKIDSLEKFDGQEQLDLSKVQLQEEDMEITGPPPIFHGKLKDYQVKGLKWLYSLNIQGINGILADQMGLGKTIQAIALLGHIAYTKNKWGPFLIVSPSSTLHNWQQQFKRFCPALKILPYWGGIKQRKVIRKYFSTKKFTSKHDSHFHVVITSYQMAVMDEKTFKRIKWQFIVLDEAHNIKNTMSQRWNVLKEFQSRSRLLLTGTPIQNNMAELWALLNFIMPELFDSHEQFNQWFSKDIEAHSQDQKQLDKIQIQRLHAILKPFMLRRVKKDVEHEIGTKHQHRILCQMTKRQKILYETIKDKLNVKELFKMIQSKTKVENLMNLVMQLRKVCNHPQLFERRPANSPFMFQEIYYYTGFTPIKSGNIKQLSFNSINPIKLNIPKLMYDQIIRFNQPLCLRNRRLLNIYTVQNMIKSENFSSIRLMNLSFNQIELCFREDQLYTAILLTHWIKRNSYTSQFSTKEYISSIADYSVDDRFILKNKLNVNTFLQDIRIPEASAPSIIPTISSTQFYHNYEQMANNKFQKFIFEGRYSDKWSHSLPYKDWEGLIQNKQGLTKIELVNFGSLIADSAKLSQLDRILKEKRAQGDKVLIFCQMTKMLDILEDFMNMRKYPFFRLDGACSLSDRRDMVNQFQKQSSKVFAFLLSTRAGGLGVTLTAANNVIFYDNDWNPTMDAQATDRAHRIGQTRDVYVYQLVTKNTIEDRIVKRAEQKKTVQSTVYQGGSLNIFKKDIMELMADQLGVQQKNEQPKKDDGNNTNNNNNNNNKKRGPKPVKPTIGKTKEKVI